MVCLHLATESLSALMRLPTFFRPASAFFLMSSARSYSAQCLKCKARRSSSVRSEFVRGASLIASSISVCFFLRAIRHPLCVKLCFPASKVVAIANEQRLFLDVGQEFSLIEHEAL